MGLPGSIGTEGTLEMSNEPMTDEQLRGNHADCYKEVQRLREENKHWVVVADEAAKANERLREENEQLQKDNDIFQTDWYHKDSCYAELVADNKRARELLELLRHGKHTYLSTEARDKIRAFLDEEKTVPQNQGH